MDNLQSLSKKVEALLTKEELKEAILNAMDKADSIEELLVLKWQFNKIYGTAARNIKKNKFNKNLERITYQNAINNSSLIIEDLKNSKSILEINDKYCTTTSSVERLLINCFEKLEEEILKLVPKFASIDISPEQDREFLCAKITINMLVETKTATLLQAKKKFGINSQELGNYLNILKLRNHPLIFKFEKLNKNHIDETYKARSNMNLEKKEIKRQKRIAEIFNLESQDIIKILSNVETVEFEMFCKAYNLEVRFFANLIKSNQTIKYKFTNKDTIKETYNEYFLKYQEVIKKIIKEIYILKGTKFKEPLNLYEYYLHNTIDINSLAKIALSYSHIERRTLILEYINNFRDLFSPIDKKSIENIKRIGIISCCQKSLKFTNTDIKKALEDINDKNLPYIKGVLYGAIKNVHELKDTKQKTKKIGG